MELKKDSWHYKVATDIGGLPNNIQLDVSISSYLKHILFGLSILFFIILSSCLVIYSVGYSIGWLYWITIYGFNIHAHNMFFTLLGLISIMSVVIHVIIHVVLKIKWLFDMKFNN